MRRSPSSPPLPSALSKAQSHSKCRIWPWTRSPLPAPATSTTLPSARRRLAAARTQRAREGRHATAAATVVAALSCGLSVCRVVLSLALFPHSLCRLSRFVHSNNCKPAVVGKKSSSQGCARHREVILFLNFFYCSIQATFSLLNNTHITIRFPLFGRIRLHCFNCTDYKICTVIWKPIILSEFF